jgi:hypothetical protein
MAAGLVTDVLPRQRAQGRQRVPPPSSPRSRSQARASIIATSVRLRMACGSGESGREFSPTRALPVDVVLDPQGRSETKANRSLAFLHRCPQGDARISLQSDKPSALCIPTSMHESPGGTGAHRIGDAEVSANSSHQSADLFVVSRDLPHPQLAAASVRSRSASDSSSSKSSPGQSAEPFGGCEPIIPTSSNAS